MVLRRDRWARLALLAVVGAAAAVVLALDPGNGSARDASLTSVRSFRSRALKRPVPFLVVLPHGYATSNRRYPVVYMLHGLPASPDAFTDYGWVAQVIAQLSQQAIVVVPQGASASQSDPEYHDWGPGENWETALGVELPRYVDSHYRTIATRAGRSIIGISAGGYGAASIGLHHPAEYSVVESWSGYFRPTDPTGETTLDVGSDAANARASIHRLVPALRKQFARYPTFFAFYVGKSDPTFVADNVQLDRELSAAHVPHVFALYAGAHSSTLWTAHAPYWLALALARLSSS
jgi:S-formylglutathione hydrolase FrmB